MKDRSNLQILISICRRLRSWSRYRPFLSSLEFGEWGRTTAENGEKWLEIYKD